MQFIENGVKMVSCPAELCIEAFLAFGRYITDNGYKESLDPVSNLFMDLYGDAITESPIEAIFYRAMRGKDIPIVPQYEIGNYRVDFAIPPDRIAIEIDGHDFHKTKEQRTSDAQRDRFLTQEGWLVVRFTGSEIYRGVTNCIAELERIVQKQKEVF